MSFGTWNDVDVLPDVKEDYGSFSHSKTVLITDGKHIKMGYAQVWKDEVAKENEVQWKLDGRDGYNIYGIIKWMELPSLPTVEK